MLNTLFGESGPDLTWIPNHFCKSSELDHKLENIFQDKQANFVKNTNFFLGMTVDLKNFSSEGARQLAVNNIYSRLYSERKLLESLKNQTNC